MPAAATTGPTGLPARPSLGWQVLALALLLGLQPIGTDLYLPALPALRAELGAAMSATQLTLSGLILAFGLGQLLMGPLSDRLGRRPVLLGGLTLYAMAGAGGALAADIELLVLCRVMQGLGLAAAVVGARAMLRDWFAPQEGARVMARALGGLGLLAMLSPPLGGLLAATLGWRWTLLAIALAGVTALVMVTRRIPESLSRRDPQALQPRRLLANWAQVAAHPGFRAYTLLTTLAYGTLYTFLAASAFVFIEVLGLGRGSYGLVVGAGAGIYVLGTLICRRWLSRLSLAATARRGALFTAIGALGMGLAAWVLPPSAPALLLPHVFIMLGHGVLQPCSQVGAVGPFPQLAGTAAALSGFVSALGAFLVGAWLSLSLDGTVRPMAATMAVLGAGAALCAWTLVQTQARSDTPA
ncbi:MAG: multidrug effflux MFS transporter [Roseateles asaccharophilus]|uniref:Bcr/CflA family efflux transporter n=1 Tax=Roseateles asaccharophilus TaxID=582607 RepID=A0A4R6N3Y4_9BURK|nr:multidrug effflux MFS transporter [Roseateles asaccharophilus]MDN3544608.1 multidrug effflux MFS transporter [Roseateles asaccharophilus]TDP09626.1 DHA1 family bicyclomycin/chloramphenicol resistance-like MFS transporter [Roseateles asaccharophilus]